jgi:hypothetical protein
MVWLLVESHQLDSLAFCTNPIAAGRLNFDLPVPTQRLRNLLLRVCCLFCIELLLAPRPTHGVVSSQHCRNHWVGPMRVLVSVSGSISVFISVWGGCAVTATTSGRPTPWPPPISPCTLVFAVAVMSDSSLRCLLRLGYIDDDHTTLTYERKRCHPYRLDGFFQ